MRWGVLDGKVKWRQMAQLALMAPLSLLIADRFFSVFVREEERTVEITGIIDLAPRGDQQNTL